MEIKALYKKFLKHKEISAPKNKVQSKKSIAVSGRGLWDKSKNKVIVPSNRITMKGPKGEQDFFKRPVLATGLQSGKQVLMQPGREYYFPEDETVFEKRMQNGGSVVINTPTAEPNKEAMTAMMKSKLAYADAFNNPTAARMTNRDSRSYTFTEEDELQGGEPAGSRGNVYVGSYDNYVTPGIQDVDGKLKYVSEPFNDKNAQRTLQQSIKFDSPEDAQYFGENYKEIAPMMQSWKSQRMQDGGTVQTSMLQPIKKDEDSLPILMDSLFSQFQKTKQEFGAQPKEELQMQDGGHVVGSGETFYGIANKYGLDKDALLTANPGLDIDKIMPGQKLNLPVVEKIEEVNVSSKNKREPTKWYNYINPLNWGAPNYDDAGAFGKAFRKARAEGEGDFMYYGKRYSSDLAKLPDSKKAVVSDVEEGEEEEILVKDTVAAKPKPKPIQKTKPQFTGNQLDLDNVIDYLVATRGGNRDTWKGMADTIAYHESAHSMDPKQKQIGGGPGRGMFQFEDPTFKTFKNRYKNVSRNLKLETDPAILAATSADQLTPKQQYTAFLVNMSQSKAPLRDYSAGRMSLEDIWLKGHKNVEKKGDRKSFQTSINKAKKRGIKGGSNTFQMGGTMSIPGVNGTVVASSPSLYKKYQRGGANSNEESPSRPSDLPPMTAQAGRLNQWLYDQATKRQLAAQAQYDIEKAIDKEQRYVNSPKYAELLTTEFYGPDKLFNELDDTQYQNISNNLQNRNENLNTLNLNFKDLSKKNIKAGYDPNLHTLYVPGSDTQRGVYSHELSHVGDQASFAEGDNPGVGPYFQQELQKSMYSKENPEFLNQPSALKKNKTVKENVEKDFNEAEYLTEPTEVKARLRALRDASMQQGYKLLSPDYDINRYKKGFTEEETKQYQQLQKAGLSDEKINEMMYLFAKNNQKPEMTARLGGRLINAYTKTKTR